MLKRRFIILVFVIGLGALLVIALPMLSSDPSTQLTILNSTDTDIEVIFRHPQISKSVYILSLRSRDHTAIWLPPRDFPDFPQAYSVVCVYADKRQPSRSSMGELHFEFPGSGHPKLMITDSGFRVEWL